MPIMSCQSSPTGVRGGSFASTRRAVESRGQQLPVPEVRRGSQDRKGADRGRASVAARATGASARGAAVPANAPGLMQGLAPLHPSRWTELRMAGFHAGARRLALGAQG